MKPSSIRTALAGIAGGILLDPDIQSGKLIDVWKTMKPLPLVVANPVPIITGIAFFGVMHAFIYRWLSAVRPPGVLRRGVRIAIILFLLVFSFWGFFTPFNQFGEPLPLIGIELFFGQLSPLRTALQLRL